MKLNIQMFAVPFRRVSKTRGRKRRTHYKISANATVTCPKCGEAIRSHRVCPKCGNYNDKQVVSHEEA
jgi:large subunit ribosomal protein L32